MLCISIAGRRHILLLVRFEEEKKLGDWKTTANMMRTAMIFLQDNVLLKRNLKSEDIKPRLLG